MSGQVVLFLQSHHSCFVPLHGFLAALLKNKDPPDYKELLVWILQAGIPLEENLCMPLMAPQIHMSKLSL